MADIFNAPQHAYTRGLVATARLDQVEPGQRLPTVEDFYDRGSPSTGSPSTGAGTGSGTGTGLGSGPTVVS